MVQTRNRIRHSSTEKIRIVHVGAAGKKALLRRRLQRRQRLHAGRAVDRIFRMGFIGELRAVQVCDEGARALVAALAAAVDDARRPAESGIRQHPARLEKILRCPCRRC